MLQISTIFEELGSFDPKLINLIRIMSLLQFKSL